MSDIKLFRVDGLTVSELASQSPQIEKSLQVLFEKNLEALLGVRFLASEHSTGAVHGGRIDTLGIDEDGSPVIIEYKRLVNENVINQGLFYLDWLMDHKKDFLWLVMDSLGKEIAEKVDWSSPRLICIATDFTKYDLHAVKQIPRSIELMRYRRFDSDMLIIELVHTPRAVAKFGTAIQAESGDTAPTAKTVRANYQSQMMDYRLSNSSLELLDLFGSVNAFLLGLGDDVQVKELKFYHAYKRIKNFVCLEVYPSENKVTAFLKVNPDDITLEPGFTRDMRKTNHFGTGNLEVTIRSDADVDKALVLFQKAYDGS
jgi:predicted transport protein